MYIPKNLNEDWDWWKLYLPVTKMFLGILFFHCTIHTDASKTGWGGYDGMKRGRWSEDQQKFHISYLELLSTWFSLLDLANNLSDCKILLRVDNITAMIYINKMGGVLIPGLNDLSRKISQWAENRRIQLVASYIKSTE